MEISVVVPVYKCKDAIHELAERVKAVMDRLAVDYELVLVDDGSPDDSWQVLKELANCDPAVKAIRMSRNFGQHEAITAGLEHSGGDWIVVLDCDLQDRPEEIATLYKKALEGFDAVYARRVIRQDSLIKKYSSMVFYRVLGYLTDTKLDHTIANFGIYSQKLIAAVLTMRESLRFFPVMVRWVGFRSTAIDVQHIERKHGQTSYSLNRLVRMATNVIVSFSDKPLRMIVKVGLWMSFLSALYAVYIFFRALLYNIPVQGWSSLMVSLWLIGGLLMSMLGVVGLYVGKTFDETKRRPHYIVADVIGTGENQG